MENVDKYEAFKGGLAAALEYRKAYTAMATRDPASVLGLPHPDDHDYDPAAALERLRGAGGGLKGVPGLDIRA